MSRVRSQTKATPMSSGVRAAIRAWEVRQVSDFVARHGATRARGCWCWWCGAGLDYERQRCRECGEWNGRHEPPDGFR